MNQSIVALLVFATLVVVAVLLFAPRVGALPNLRRRRRDTGRIRLEDTLKHIYEREDRGDTATLASVTDGLRVPSAVALKLVQRMQHAKLLSVVDDRLLLTEDGKKYALQVIRAHRLWERYLADETGISPERWHEVAERREHTITPDQAEALSRRLGNPRFDPHGDPIPTSEGEVPDESIVPLTRMKEGDNARVVHIEDEPQAVYAQLIALGLYVGMELRVETKSEERLIVETEDGRKLVLAPIVAGNLSIQKIPEQEVAPFEGAPESLVDLREGEVAEVRRISPACRGLERRRLMDLGILPGTAVEYERQGLFGGLKSFRVRDTVIALREEQARMITIHKRERVPS